MSVPKTKDILSLMQSRIALRANFLSEFAPSGAADWPAVEDQKADKRALAEIVKLRREVNLCLQVPYQRCQTKERKMMKKLVFGVGVNDLGYRTQVEEEVTENGGKRVRKIVFKCKYYSSWTHMLERCYSEKYLETRPSYIGTSVCSEWLSATAFKKWMEQQDWQDKSLDKDIITPGSRLYSPETCAFVLKATNSFVARDASRGGYPTGVHLYKRTGKYQAHCNNPFTGEKEYLGLFSTPEDAHEAWRKRKHELAQLVAAKEADPRIVEALKNVIHLRRGLYRSLFKTHTLP